MLDPQPFARDLRAARAGDRAAMDRLLNDLRPWLERVASYRGSEHGPDASLADLVQEASLQAWLKLAQFRGHDDDEQELKMFCGWLQQIVRRLGQNQLRHARARRRYASTRPVSLNANSLDSSRDAVHPPAGDPTASAAAAAAEADRDVRAAIADLPDAIDRLIVHESFFGGRSLRELADTLEMDRETVRRRFHSVLDGLRDKLKGHL